MVTWQQLPEADRGLLIRANDLLMRAARDALDNPGTAAWMTVGDARAVFLDACHVVGIDPDEAIAHV